MMSDTGRACRKKHPRPFLPSRGFTLIELFIAISIFSVVAVALYSAFFAGISVWQRSSESGNIDQDIKFILDDINKDFRNMLCLTNKEESIFAFSGSEKKAAIITETSPFSEGDSSRRELAKVVYEFDDKTGELTRRIAGKDLGFDIEKAGREILLKGIEDLKFSYCYFSGSEDDPYLWEGEWKDSKMRIPKGVRLIFKIKPEDAKESLNFTKTILIPTGIRGEKEVGL